MLNAAIISAIEDFAPSVFQESWDNTGVQVGSLRAECTGVLICLDVTPAVVDEARDRGCNLIISHHPLLFKGLKRISGNSPVEESVMSAIAYGITIYSCHTAVDSTPGGVSYSMARMLGANPVRVLQPLTGRFAKVTAIVTPDCVAQAITTFNEVSPSSKCFSSDVENYSADVLKNDPFATTDITSSPCVRIEATVDSSCATRLCDMLTDTLATGLLSVTNELTEKVDPKIGLGVYATFDGAGITPLMLIERVKTAFSSPVVRCTAMPGNDISIRRIAMCGGSGSEFISAAIRAGAQAFITSDTRYHDFVDYQNEILLIDIGHYESESCTKEIFYNVIREKFPNFACYYSEIEVNPIKYI